MFVLLARDEKAPEIVRKWVERRYVQRSIQADSTTLMHDEKEKEAIACANAMERWREDNRIDKVSVEGQECSVFMTGEEFEQLQQKVSNTKGGVTALIEQPILDNPSQMWKGIIEKASLVGVKLPDGRVRIVKNRWSIKT